jgi:hypothetical protein
MDYYATLGLQRNASDAEIKKAYRSMAMKYHPDRGGDEKKFKEISQAYEFLSDPQKKQIIDLGGDPNAQPGMGGGQGPFEFHFNTGNMNDIFGNFGFGGFGRQPQRRNRSLNINVEITLEDVLSGKDFTAEVSIPGKNKMINIQIPYTFYNIEARQGNNHFIINEVLSIDASGNRTYDVNREIVLEDGHYETLEDLVRELNLKILSYGLAFTINPLTKKCTLTNTSARHYHLTFLTQKSKINHCIGWHLGFRKFQGSNLANKYITLDYDLPRATPAVPNTSPSVPSSISGLTVATVPHAKYFVLVVDDFNHNQTADTMIQNNIKPENSKPTSYFTQDPLLDMLLPDNLDSYLTNVSNRSLTKSQLYTIAQQNLEKQNLYIQNTRLEIHAPNQVMGIIPFEESKSDWGSIIFSDKNKYTREYHSPTNIDRMHVKIYDDKGFLLNLNGNNWSMSMITHNLYKY